MLCYVGDYNFGADPIISDVIPDWKPDATKDRRTDQRLSWGWDRSGNGRDISLGELMPYGAKRFSNGVLS